MQAGLQSAPLQVSVETDRAIATFSLPADYPYFEGHFPAMPIVPGVVQIAWAKHCLETLLGRPLEAYSLSRVKFLAPILPGDAIRVIVDREQADRFRLSVESAGVVVSKGHLSILPT